MRKNEAAWVESRKRWQIKVQSEGERKTFTDSTPGKKGKIAAERKADRWLEDHLTGDGLRSDVLLDRFLQKKKDTTSEGNYEQVEKYVRLYIRPVIGKKKIGRLTENDLQEIIDRAYSNGLAYKTLCNIRGTISSFMKYCRKDKATTLFPESLVVPAGAKRGEKHIAQPNEVKTLFNSDKTCYYGKEISDRYIHAYRFAVLTGIRPGELLGLQWSDVNGDKLTIRRSLNNRSKITQGKNQNARRSISLKGLALAELEAQRAMLARRGEISQYIFPAPDSGFTTQQSFRFSWHRYCEHNGIGHLTPYELRHTYVSINDDMPDGLKKKAIGHSANMDTEGVYGHLKAGDLDRIAEYSSTAVKKIIGE